MTARAVTLRSPRSIRRSILLAAICAPTIALAAACNDGGDPGTGGGGSGGSSGSSGGSAGPCILAAAHVQMCIPLMATGDMVDCTPLLQCQAFCTLGQSCDTLKGLDMEGLKIYTECLQSCGPFM